MSAVIKTLDVLST